MVTVDVENMFDQKKTLKADFTQKQQEYAQHKEALKETKQKQQSHKPEPQRIPAMCITKCSTMYVVHSLIAILVNSGNVYDKCNKLSADFRSCRFQRQRTDAEHKDIPVCRRLIDFCQKVSKDYGGDEKINKRQKKVSWSG